MSANNAALNQVHNALVWWESLSMIDRRTRTAKERAAMVLEAAILTSVSARSQLDVNKGAAGKEDKDGDGKPDDE